MKAPRSDKSSRYDLAANQQSTAISNIVWGMVATLTVMTFVHMVGVVHDNRSWEAPLRGIVLATAEQHAERANERLQLQVGQTFAKAEQIGSGAAMASNLVLQEVALSQREGIRCRCRATLPAREFFSVGPNDKLDRLGADDSMVTRTSIRDSTLLNFAHSVRSAPEFHAANARLFVRTQTGNQAVITWTMSPSGNPGGVVFGLIGDRHDLLESLFSRNIRYGNSVAEMNYKSFALDSLSLRVSRNDSVLYGSVDSLRPIRGRVVMEGAMDGLWLTVAPNAEQSHFVPTAARSWSLWMLGFLTIATVLAVILGISISRREMFTARARSDFIAGTSHDFRMPLAQILLAGETLTMRDDISGEVRTGLTKTIVRETRRLIAMVENVLLFSRSGAVDIEPALQTLNVGEVFGDVIESVQLAVNDVGQTILASVDSTIAVRGDRQLLRQALVNLVDNAIKYGKEKQRIRVGAAQHSAMLVRLWVDDDGPGIPESQRERVFEPYGRLTRDQASERAGSGLGLAVAQHIAKASGGRIWIESAPSGGARALLELNSATS
ncbi:MAG: HAMP domain-containing sensor histidine kinase [Gemmatimonadaceae bacterium]